VCFPFSLSLLLFLGYHHLFHFPVGQSFFCFNSGFSFGSYYASSSTHDNTSTATTTIFAHSNDNHINSITATAAAAITHSLFSNSSLFFNAN
jgi:hypothetical protein